MYWNWKQGFAFWFIADLKFAFLWYIREIRLEYIMFGIVETFNFTSNWPEFPRPLVQVEIDK